MDQNKKKSEFHAFTIENCEYFEPEKNALLSEKRKTMTNFEKSKKTDEFDIDSQNLASMQK